MGIRPLLLAMKLVSFVGSLISEGTLAGAILFTRTPSRVNFDARFRVTLSAAALLALYMWL